MRSIFLTVIYVLASSQILFAGLVDVPVNIPTSVSAEVTPGMTSVRFSFSVSEVNEVALNVIVPVSNPTLQLLNPDGKDVLQASGVALEYHPGTEVDPSGALPGGVFTVDNVKSPANGLWTITANFAPASEKVVVYATVFLKSRYQAGIALVRPRILVGEDVLIGAIILDDGKPVTGATVKFGTLSADPLTPNQTGFGHDDGLAGDGLADDGIYTEDFVFTEPGVFLVTATILFTTPNGAVSRTAAATLEVVPPTLKINKISSKISQSPQGCNNSIAVVVEGEVLHSGDFAFNATLEGSNSKTLQGNAFAAALPTGAFTLSIPFDSEDLVKELSVDGPYSIASFNAFEVIDDFELQFEGHALGKSEDFPLDKICRDPVEIESGLGITPVLASGFIKHLKSRFVVNVSTGGFYSISFKILSATGEDVSLVAENRQLTAGKNELDFILPAASFLTHDGPYSFVSVLVVGPSGGGQLSFLGSTSAFERWQFETPLKGDLDNNNTVDNKDRSILIEHRGKHALSPGDRRDLNGDGTIDVRDIRAILKLFGKSSAGANRRGNRQLGSTTDSEERSRDSKP